jgi:hypothetical protein
MVQSSLSKDYYNMAPTVRTCRNRIPGVQAESVKQTVDEIAECVLFLFNC